MTDYAGRRQDYARSKLRRAELPREPLILFRSWFEEALASDLAEPYAVTVATADATGRPSARMVLLRAFDERGFVFYTNFDSRKARDLHQNPQAALLFYWPTLERQVRIEGRVDRVSDAEADAYFATRPRGSQLAAHASGRQSSVIVRREELEERYAALEVRYPDIVPRPENWGGYRVIPDAFEFWQGRPSRMHDRFQYTLRDNGWSLERLAP